MMHTLKITTAVAALLLCGGLSAQPATSQNPAKVVTYLFEVFSAKDALVQAMLKETSTEPELQTIAKGALAAFDVESLALQFSKPLSQALSPNESEQCLAFIKSEGGAALLAASQRASSPSDLPRHLDLLAPEEQRAVLDFFNSSCYKKTTGFMGSQEARQISRNYGKSLMCSYAERTSVEMLRVLRSHGECQAPSAGGPYQLRPNNSFKPKLLRYTKAMADKACHGFGSTTQVGLTQALGAVSSDIATGR